MALTTLETNILLAKGVTAEQLARLADCGIAGRADFATIGDGETLSELTGLSPELATRVMAWALGRPSTGGEAPTPPPAGTLVVQSADVIFCIHCNAKQPKDYKAGDLCFSCGKQAEPVLTCFWCGATGPGKFCRVCGAEFVPTGELELAVMLRYEGQPKNDIPAKLLAMTAAEKEALWGRVRRARSGRA